MTKCAACGQQTRGRSVPDHRRLFALIAAAYDNWPHNHRFTPDNTEHLRAWLACAAKYRNVVIIEKQAGQQAHFDAAVAATLAGLRKLGIYCWKFPHEHGALIVSPKSMAFDKLDRDTFGELRDAIEHVIETELGVPAEQLIRERDNAA